MEQIIIMGKLKKEVKVNNKEFSFKDILKNNNKDFIKDLFSDSKEIIGFTDETMEIHNRDFEDEPIRYIESKLKFEENEFYFKLSRKTYEKNIKDAHMIIECNIKYESNEHTGLIKAAYDLKEKIRAWLDKYCEEIYWIHDDNNTEICVNTYAEIHRIENKFRGILSLYMIRKYGEIFLRKDIESNKNYKDNKEKYKHIIGSDFNSIKFDFYNIGFKELPNLLNMKKGDIKLLNRDIPKKVQHEFDDNDDYIFNENLLHNLDYEYYEKEEESKKNFNKDNFVQKGMLIVYEDKNLYKYKRKIDNFQNKWKRLGDLRNIVMHNKLISADLVIEILELCSDFDKKFDDCLEFIEDDFFTEEDDENTQRWNNIDLEIELEEERQQD